MSSHIDAPARHKHNASLLGQNDVVIAAYPGSGSSLLGNIVLELGFDHLDPYTEVLDANGAAEMDAQYEVYRSRLAATARQDGAAETVPDERLRFFKNHLYPDEFRAGSLYGAVLLVRDPRDSIHSSYQYFRSFSGWLPGAPAGLGQGPFAEFLDGLGINGAPPVQGWARFCRRWLDAGPTFRRFAVVHFENLKADGVAATAEMLAQLDLDVAPARIAAAVEGSSFSAMRAHEDQVAARENNSRAQQARLVRRGKVNEWQEWFSDPGMAARFTDAELVAVAAELGYTVSARPESGD
jgi:hypothetical protein